MYLAAPKKDTIFLKKNGGPKMTWAAKVIFDRRVFKRNESHLEM